MSEIPKIFIGYDQRSPLSYNVCQHSIIRQASKPVMISPLVLKQLPISRKGLTEFTFSRFLVPWLCHYEGWALFMDSDIILTADIMELFAERDPGAALQVVQTEQQFERAAVMLFNCAHPDNLWLSPEYIQCKEKLLQFCWTEEVGSFSHRWQYVIGYDKQPPENCGLIHYTMGVPAWNETRDCAESDKWVAELRMMNSTVTWADLMGNSIHATRIDGVLQPKYKAA